MAEKLGTEEEEEDDEDDEEESETHEESETPKAKIERALSKIEEEDASDAIISSDWGKRAKGALKGSAMVAAGGLYLCWRTIRGVLEFAGEVVKKKGNVGFAGGYEIGKEIFNPPSSKKEKR